jgi:hypothetical protein
MPEALPKYPGRPIRPPAQHVAAPPPSQAPVARRAPSESRAGSELVARFDVANQLSACIELLAWLDMQLERHKTPELVRERALARVVVQEAAALVDQCRAKLR